MAHILNIPEDVLDLIIRQMDLHSLTALSRTCKHLQHFCDQDQYWELRAKPEWKPLPQLPHVTWKQLVLGISSYGPYAAYSASNRPQRSRLPRQQRNTTQTAAGYHLLQQIASNNSNRTHLAVGRYKGPHSDASGGMQTGAIDPATATGFDKGVLRQIGDPGVMLFARALTSNTFVRFVRLESVRLGLAGCIALRDALVGNTHVRELILSSNEIGNGHGFQYIAELVGRNTNIVRMAFARCSLTDQDAHLLVEALAAGGTVRGAVLLAYNHLTPAAAADLAALLSYASAPNYDCCGKLGDEAALVIARAAASTLHLTSLNMGHLGFGDAPACILLQATEILPKLTVLRMHDNHITSVGARFAAQLYHDNWTKRSPTAANTGIAAVHVFLSGNEIDSEGILALATEFTSGTWLVPPQLDISNNGSVTAEAWCQLLRTGLQPSHSIASSFDRTVEGDVAAALWAARAGDPYPVIDFTGTALNVEAVRIIADALAKNSTVRELRLSDCGLKNDAAAILATALSQQLAGLSVCDLSNSCSAAAPNKFSAAVLVDLVRALCNSCETVCLANVAATDEVATAVAEAISTAGCRLRSVDLSSNEISDTGAIALLRACAQHAQKTRVRLQYNPVSREVIAALTAASK